MPWSNSSSFYPMHYIYRNNVFGSNEDEYILIDSVNVIRHAGSFSENDYYKNYGTYSMNNEIINLDIEGDLFPRNINNDTLELFIGVHLNNTLVCICEYFEGDFNDYFKIIIFNESLL